MCNLLGTGYQAKGGSKGGKSERRQGKMAFTDSPVLVGIIVALLTAYGYSTFVAWDRLRHIKGPTSTGWSGLWLFLHILDGKQPQHFREVVDQYGELCTEPGVLQHCIASEPLSCLARPERQYC